jgi:chromosome segregation ATPase
MDNDEIDDGSPDRVEALAENLVDLRQQFSQAQAKQTESLDKLNGKFNQLERATSENKLKLFSLDAEVRVFRQEITTNFNWLRGQFTSDDGLLVGLNREMYDLRDNVTVIEVKVDKLEGKVEELQADVRELKTDVGELKTDMVEVKGSLKEILDRLPPAAA